MSSQVSSSSTPAFIMKLIPLWQALTKPAHQLSPQQTRQARVVSSLILGSWMIYTIIFFLSFILLQDSTSLTSTHYLNIIALVIVFVSYIVSRTKYYLQSIWIYVLVIIVSLSLIFMGEKRVMYGTFLIFAPFVNSFVGRWWQTAVIGLVSVVIFSILYLATFGRVDSDLIMVSTLVGVSAMALSFISFLNEYSRSELEKTTDQLKQQVAITEESRKQAERSDKVKSAFLASMSHELRTPLNSIINFTRFVADGDMGPVNEQQSELLTQVVASSKHLLALINDVLDMSKIESGSLNLFIEEDVNIPATLNTGIATVQSFLLDKPIVLKTDIAEDLPLIRGDKQRIFQILLNILSNACKFTWEGEIHVRAYREKDEILISIADTGPGIAPEDQAMVFEPFKQTQTGLRQGGGTGLGMPIAKNLAEAHHGRIWLESVYGKGTTFYVALPVNFNG